MSTKIVALGDSLTAGYAVRYGRGWVELLEEMYPDRLFCNRGMPGDSTSGMLQRLPRCLKNVHPDILLFMGGSNDLLQGYPVEHILQNIRKIHDICQQQGIRMILLQCPPITHHPGPYAWFYPMETENLHQQFAAYRAAVLDYARQQELICVNIPEALPEEEEEDLILEDGVHLTEYAHRKIAEYIFRQQIL